MWRKIKLFLTLRSEMQILLLEAFVFLAWARMIKSLPFSRLVPSLGLRLEETPLEIEPARINILKNVSRAVNMMSRHTWWESKCMVKALAAMRMLEKRNIDSTLYLGTGRDAAGKMVAHAWLRSGPLYLTGAEEMDCFTVVGKFAKSISRNMNQRSTSNG